MFSLNSFLQQNNLQYVVCSIRLGIMKGGKKILSVLLLYFSHFVRSSVSFIISDEIQFQQDQMPLLVMTINVGAHLACPERMC